MSRDRRLRRFVDAVLRDRRPPRFEADAEEARMLQAAASLRGARPAGDLPSVEFVRGLEQRLRAELEAPTAPRREQPTRRGFLIGGGIAAAAAAGVAVDLGIRHTTGSPDETQGELVPHAGTWEAVATLADVAGGRPHLFRTAAISGVLVQAPGGAVHALSAVCTHMGCLLQTTTDRLVCPCHNASFDLEGSPLDREYLTTPLPRLRSRVVGDRIEVLVV